MPEKAEKTSRELAQIVAQRTGVKVTVASDGYLGWTAVAVSGLRTPLAAQFDVDEVLPELRAKYTLREG